MTDTAVVEQRSATRGPAASPRIPNLDGYRAVAAIGVLVYHTSGFSGFLEPTQAGAHLVDNLGNFGVAVFFLLSGVVIFLPFVAASLDVRPRPATAPFFIRRALRVFPGYWIALIAWALTASKSAREIGTVMGKIFLTEPYDGNIKYIPGLGVSWTLTIEVSFYLMLPIYGALLHFVARRRSTRDGRLRVHLVGLGVLYLTPNLFRVFVDRWHDHPAAVLNWLPHFLDWFALGMLLATCFAWRGSGGRLPTSLTGLANRPWACWTITLVCYGIVVVLKDHRIHWLVRESTAQTAWRMIFQGTAAFFALLPAVLGRNQTPAMRWFNTRPAVFLGTISYGIYLWHTVVLMWIPSAFESLSRGPRLFAMSAAVFAITVPIATISYYLIEQPFSVLYRKRTATARAPTTGTPAT